MKLAIKGHPTRGGEVIQLLEMLGGENKYNLWGDAGYYVIEYGEILEGEYIFGDEQYAYFTLEEFESEFPYKVGDKVIVWIDGYRSICNVQNMEWDSIANEIKYKIQDYWYSTINLQPYKEETMEERKYTDLRLDVDQDDKLATEVTIDGNKITPPENYLIGKITKVDNGMLVEFVKKQPQYPKDYEECCKVLDIDTQFCMKYLPHGTFSYKEKIIYNLQELIICRDAYWKIAGKQLGLDKPWKPDWDNLSTTREFIKINKGCFIYSSRVLVFPTEEMRDAFYENFKEEIEMCKELL